MKCSTMTGAMFVFLAGALLRPAPAAPLGSPSNPALSAKHIKTVNPAAANGLYWIDLDGPGGDDPFQIYADMTSAGGGWTLALNSVQGSCSATTDIVSNTGTVGLTTGHTRDLHRLAVDQTAQIRHRLVDTSPTPLVFDGYYSGQYHDHLGNAADWTYVVPSNTNMLSYHFGRLWTTVEEDHDDWQGGNGAVFYGVPWYYGALFTTIPTLGNTSYAANYPNPPYAVNSGNPIDAYQVWVRETSLPTITVTSLNWELDADGSWDNIGAWSRAVRVPSANTTVTIQPPSPATVSINGAPKSANSVTVGGNGSAAAVLKLEIASKLTVYQGLTLAEGGTLAGDGTEVVADVLNGGSVAPGLPLGSLMILGDYTQTDAGALLIDIVGDPADPGSCDQLSVSGNAALNGILRLDFSGLTQSSAGASYTFLTAGGNISGAFDTVSVEGLAPGFSVEYVPGAGAFTLVPEPSTLVLLIAGGLGLLSLVGRKAVPRVSKPKTAHL